MSRMLRTWVRLLGGGAILAVLVRRPGTGPSLDGIGMVDGRSPAAAVASLPGAGVLFVAWLDRRTSRPDRADAPRPRVTASPEAAARG
jgi:hypothetical protein